MGECCKNGGGDGNGCSGGDGMDEVSNGGCGCGDVDVVVVRVLFEFRVIVSHLGGLWR